ncbi:protein of unknown function [Nitrospira japonica]|uniref:Uncharacterized protein n=1 Tax=Nitrospira japonica TaxID=1325564 RepID=A0A1W1I1Y6_9BACT|nr:protein of unknown function [Nitrospira japonica]
MQGQSQWGSPIKVWILKIMVETLAMSQDKVSSRRQFAQSPTELTVEEGGSSGSASSAMFQQDISQY